MEMNKIKHKGILCLSVVFIIVLIVFSPLFNFVYISVHGNFQISSEEILERAGLTDSGNFFLFAPNRAEKDIMQNPYIDQVVFTRTFPDTLEIRVIERFLSGFIEHVDGMFLYVDEFGRVIEVRSYKSEELPIITGLRFSSFHLGELLPVNNPDAFNAVVVYAQLLNRHGLVDRISQLDVSDPNNIRLRIYSIEVYLGDTRNAHEKISILDGILDVWYPAPYTPGFLDLREPGRDHIFRILR